MNPEVIIASLRIDRVHTQSHCDCRQEAEVFVPPVITFIPGQSPVIHDHFLYVWMLTGRTVIGLPIMLTTW